MKRHLLLLLLCSATVLLHAEQVTYTVHSAEEVVATGDEPEGSTAEFFKSSTTGQKGQMTKGNHTLLTLHGFDGIKIHRVSLQMHSNSKSGSGTLQMKAGNNTVWEIADKSFADKSWNGEYSTEPVEVEKIFDNEVKVGKNQTVTIKIEATQNSLFIESYTIDYTAPEARAMTVRFLTGTTDSVAPQTEAQPGLGIDLPDYDYDDGTWHFFGWTETPVYEKEFYGKCMKAGSRYFPNKNTYLYALFSNEQAAELFYNDTTYQSGNYVIIDYFQNTMATAGVASGQIEAQSIEPVEKAENGLYIYPYDNIIAESIYHIEFSPDSTLTIKNSSDNSYVGFNENKSDIKLNKQPSQWSWRPLADNTLWIYHTWAGGTTRSLGSWDNKFECTTVIYKNKSLLLFNINDLPAPVKTLYTCFAQQVADDDEEQNDEDALSDIHSQGITIQNNRIHNPNKIRFILYNISGVSIIQSDTDTDLFGLPTGVYILQTNTAIEKVFVP